jgi:hypothetical protein
LHFTYLLARNPHIAEFAYAGCDRIRDLVARDQCVHYRARPNHASASIRMQKHRPPLDSDFPHRFRSKVITVNVKCFQGICGSAF